MSKQPSQNNSFVATARVAAELHSVMSEAKRLSLVAKNAKAMSTRAGQIAVGFNPITEFIETISQQAMKGVQDINVEALALALESVDEHRTNAAFEKFSDVLNDNGDAKYINTIKIAKDSVEKSLTSKRKHAQKRLNKLVSLLNEMDQCMLSGRSIASVSRVITADMGEYSERLSSVADNLESAVSSIKNKIELSYSLLQGN